MADIVSENQEIEKSIRENARNLLKEGKVDLIIGYTESTLPLTCEPIFVRSEEDVEKLTWNNFNYVNLATYLVPEIVRIEGREKIPLKVGVISKGCTARAIIQLIIENQINKENIKIIGIPCNGLINRKRIEKELGEKDLLELVIDGDNIIAKGKDFKKTFPFKEYLNELCKTCKIKAPPKSSSLEGVIIGESQEITTIDNDFSDLNEYESKSPEEKWEYIKDTLKNCISCYACREACPMCYCNLCFVDQNKPIWFGKTSDFSDIFAFHLIRAFHSAGRCVECGACSSVCPMGIDLHLITRKLEKIVKERFDFTSGLNLETVPPKMDFKMDDRQEFMLEED